MYETNQIKKTWDSSSLKIALVYPNQYAAMAGLTVQTLYSLWNHHPHVICERFFMPSLETSDLYPHISSQILKKPQSQIALNFPPLKSIENHMMLQNFDIVAFSLCYEMDYGNMLWILENAKIPIRSSARLSQNHSEHSFPIILAGGVAVRSNFLPIQEFCDVFFIGEIEPSNHAFLNAWFQNFNNPSLTSQSEINNAFLRSLLTIPGFYIHPTQLALIHTNEFLKKKKKTVNRVYVADLDRIDHPIYQIIPQYEQNEKSSLPFHKAIFIEVNRGCPHLCRFCLTGSQLKPFRNRSLLKLKTIIQESIQRSNPERVVLIGSSVTDHPQIEDLCQFLNEIRMPYSIPSIRIETLTSSLVKILRTSGMHTLTFAPETGSNQLRRKIGKRITNAEILKGSQLLLQNGFHALKMYFLFGLPGETIADVEAIINLVFEIEQFCSSTQKLKISLNPFIPKPHTPFEIQFEHLIEPNFSQLTKHYEMIKQAFDHHNRISLETLSLEEAYIQMLFSLGDASFGSIIEDFYRSSQKTKQFAKSIQKGSYLRSRIIFDYLTVLKTQDFGQHPWNFVDQGLSPTILKNQWNHTIS